MKKQVWIITLVLLLAAALASAEAMNIILQAPADNISTTKYSQDFLFSFTQLPSSILNCSLLIDNQVKGYRNTLLQQNNNKISVTLEAGSHSWFILCIDSGLNEIVSATRTITLNQSSAAQEGYQTIYNPDGLRSYLLTIAPGQSPVTLPAMKAGEDIRISLGGKIYYIDVIKMGNDVNTTFVEVRNRATNKYYRMLTPDSADFDFNNDSTTDVRLYLSNVERGVNAYFIVIPYPAAQEQPANTSAANQSETTTQPAEQNNEIGTEQPSQAENFSTEQPTQGNEQTSAPTAVTPTAAAPRNSLWIIIGSIFLVIIIIIVVFLVLENSGKGKKKKTSKTDFTPKKGAGKVVIVKKGEVKKEQKKEETNKPSNDAPVVSNHSDEAPVSNEKFEIIKSTGRRFRK